MCERSYRVCRASEKDDFCMVRVKNNAFQKRVNARIGFAEVLERMTFIWMRVKQKAFSKVS